MKILSINLKPDLTYFSKRGLDFDIDYLTHTEIFKPRYITLAEASPNNYVKVYSPDAEQYLNSLQTNDYDFILVGWNPKDYGNEFNRSGGWACPIQLKSGALWATIRLDGNENNYTLHELHHQICRKIVNKGLVKDVSEIDFMDKTPVNGVMIPFYKNENPEAIDGNFAYTWSKIQSYLDKLKTPVVYIKRFMDDGVQTLGELSYGYFKCKTLERAWKDNKPNLSCIPKGRYLMKWTFSPRLMKYTYEAQKVYGRSGIRIHSGTRYLDSVGCIILGSLFQFVDKDQYLDVINSKKTIEDFNKLMNKQDFYLDIN